MNIPSNYVVFGASNNGNQVTYRRSDSSAEKPKLLILDRKESVYDASKQKYSVPELRVRVLSGVVNSDNQPVPERLLIDASFRLPVGSASDQAQLFADFTALLNDPDFWDELAVGHLFPTCCEE